MSRPVTLFTGQWADLPLDELAEKLRRLGLRRARARRAGAITSTSPRRCATPATSPGGARAARAPRARLLGDRQPPRRPGRVRPDRRAPPRRPAARGVGRRRSGGRAPARGRADEGHRPGGRAARRRRGHRVHRLADLAPALLLPAERLRRDRARLRGRSPSAGARSSTSSRPRASASRSRSTPPRSPTTSSRRARRSTAIGDRHGFGINFDPSHLEHQFLDSAAFIAEFGDRIDPRARQGLQAPARRALVDPGRPPGLRRRPGAAGTSSPPATATSTSRRSSAR